MGGNVKAGQSANDNAAALSVAVRLLEMQQQLEAWDRLYNQEIGTLQKELSQLKADFVRQQKAQAQVDKPKRRRAPRKPLDTTDTAPGDV
jgi:Skp family chaperone for outer membrane proteins